MIIISAIMIDVPSMRPSGNPDLIIPITTDATAAKRRIILIGSSKFSAISSPSVLIFGGGK